VENIALIAGREGEDGMVILEARTGRDAKVYLNLRKKFWSLLFNRIIINDLHCIFFFKVR
jgi:hypothetical protein